MAADFFDDADDGDYSDTATDMVITDPDTGDVYDVGLGLDTTSLLGDGNAPPLVSDPPQSATSGTAGAGTTQNLLGSVGSLISNAPKIGTSLGTALGTAENNIKTGISNFTGSSTAAASGNSLSVWWANAATTDKVMIGLAVVGIIVALKK